MAKPYSIDLRERVVAAVRSGRSCRDVADTFGVSVASVVKWGQRFRKSGSVAPGQMGGHRTPVLESERAWLVARISSEPDVTTRVLADELSDRGIEVDHTTVWRFLRGLDLSHKKKRSRERAGSP